VKILLSGVGKSNVTRRTPRQQNSCESQTLLRTNLAKPEQIWPFLPFKFVRIDWFARVKTMKAMRNIELSGQVRTVAPPLLFQGNISAHEGVIHEIVDRDDVQKGARAQNQTAGVHLQTLRCAHLLSELPQASPRSPRPRDSLIAIKIEHFIETHRPQRTQKSWTENG
jgi:hypothetical protein